MQLRYTPPKLTILGALVATAALTLAGAPASAQTATMSSTDMATSSSTSTTTTAKKKPPTSATADMINEAIQRSQARAAKAQQTGTPEQFGSEEPFVYDPTKQNFTAAQQ